MKIAIKYGDNDFHSTFLGVLATLRDAYGFGGNENLTESKENLTFIINELSLGIYMSHQNHFKYTNGQTMYDHIEQARKYLKILESDILVEDEVTHYLIANSVDGDNGETFILDTDLIDVDYPGQYTTYSI
tara:strand:+ start:49 stop:441 length:393 start_codon:yes stop_codon:yes gene_type:complete